MFREPLSHASSLLAMHKRYCDMQMDDSFGKEYMDWLAHHEFGLGQKPYRFPTTSNLPKGNPMELDYWIESWINHYQEALDIDDHNVHFISYEAYCERPDEVFNYLVEACEFISPWRPIHLLKMRDARKASQTRNDWASPINCTTSSSTKSRFNSNAQRAGQHSLNRQEPPRFQSNPGMLSQKLETYHLGSSCVPLL